MISKISDAEFEATRSKFFRLLNRFRKKPTNKTRSKEFYRFFVSKLIDVRHILGHNEWPHLTYANISEEALITVVKIYSFLLYHIDVIDKNGAKAFSLICGGAMGFIPHPQFQLCLCKHGNFIPMLFIICCHCDFVLSLPHTVGYHGIRPLHDVIACMLYFLSKNPTTQGLIKKTIRFEEVMAKIDLEKGKLLSEEMGMPMLGERLKMKCENCDKPESENREFKKCARCRKVLYCSKKCQKKHWKQKHKSVCRPVKDFSRILLD